MSSADWITRFDAACERWTDRLNPMLVKETRQSLRSRSFSVAFLITLGASWCLSVVLVGTRGESLQLGESGPDFFLAYLGALLLPLCFVVPLGVFRSATAEFAGQTFEVLAASTQFTTCRPTSPEWQRRQPRRREGWRPVPRAPRTT